VIRAVVDEVVPLDVVSVLSDERVVVDAFPESWRSLSDGAVIANAIGKGYAWLITCDKRMAFQQNLFGSTISVLVLPTPRVPDLERIQRNVRAALGKPVPGHFVILDTDGLLIGRPVPHLAGPAKRTP
jgi:hypothetical protein